jgi:hypothetical protein
VEDNGWSAGQVNALPKEQVILVPYGAAKLRIRAFPQIAQEPLDRMTRGGKMYEQWLLAGLQVGRTVAPK